MSVESDLKRHSEAQVKDGRNTNAVELAEQIIEAQTAEIQEMQEMLKSL